MNRARFLTAAISSALALMTLGVRDSSAVLLILNSNSVIGGSAAWNYDNYDVGVYNAFHVVDNQTGDINEVVGNYWLGRQTGLSQYFVLDLGAAYPIFQIDLFNTHNATVNDRGTRNFHVDVANSVTFVNGNVDYDLVSPVQILSGTLTQRNSSNDPIIADSYSLSPTDEYRYLRFTADNYYGSQGSGLNEIRVFVPEPSTAMLLMVGAVASQLRRRRKAR